MNIDRFTFIISVEIEICQKGTVQIGLGGSTKLTARIKLKHNQPVTIRWQKLENNVSRNLNINTRKYSGSSCELPTPELVINDADQLDAGIYQLQVTTTTETVNSTPVVVEIFGGNKS